MRAERGRPSRVWVEASVLGAAGLGSRGSAAGATSIETDAR